MIDLFKYHWQHGGLDHTEIPSFYILNVKEEINYLNSFWKTRSIRLYRDIYYCVTEDRRRNRKELLFSLWEYRGRILPFEVWLIKGFEFSARIFCEFIHGLIIRKNSKLVVKLHEKITTFELCEVLRMEKWCCAKTLALYAHNVVSTSYGRRNDVVWTLKRRCVRIGKSYFWIYMIGPIIWWWK